MSQVPIIAGDCEDEGTMFALSDLNVTYVLSTRICLIDSSILCRNAGPTRNSNNIYTNSECHIQLMGSKTPPCSSFTATCPTFPTTTLKQLLKPTLLIQVWCVISHMYVYQDDILSEGRRTTRGKSNDECGTAYWHNEMICGRRSRRIGKEVPT